MISFSLDPHLLVYFLGLLFTYFCGRGVGYWEGYYKAKELLINDVGLKYLSVN